MRKHKGERDGEGRGGEAVVCRTIFIFSHLFSPRFRIVRKYKLFHDFVSESRINYWSKFTYLLRNELICKIGVKIFVYFIYIYIYYA